MKKCLCFIFLLFAMQQMMTAQEGISKEELFRLYHKAQKEERSGNREDALEIYKTLLRLDPSFSMPYLKMANIYAANEDGESAAAALALYNKYLTLQPNDEHASVIKGKVAQLQSLGVDGQGVNLADIIYINQEESKNIIATKARLYGRATTPEELERQVVETSALYTNAQKAISDNDIEAGVQYAEQLMEQTDPANPLSTQTNMMLAEVYGKQGNVQKMQDVLTTLDEDIAIYKQMRQNSNTTPIDVSPFEEDICGIWVSDLANGDSKPFLAIEIIKNKKDPNRYNAKVLPYCVLAEKHKMYTGKSPQYEAVYNKKSQGYFAYSLADSVSSKPDEAYFYFGDKKFLGTSAGLDKYLINPMVSTAEFVTKDAVNTAADNVLQSASKLRIPVIGTGIEMVGSLIQLGFSLATMKKTTEVSLEVSMQRRFAGCVDINLIHNTFVSNSKGNERKSVDSLQMRMYKLQPGETIASFNKQSYQKLSERVSDYCFSKAEENPEFKELAYDCRMRFEYASKGLSYRTIRNKDGVFEGWVDMSGKRNGVGKCTLNDETTYIGSWENNKYSGDGKITFRDRFTYDVVEEYTGGFKNNKYHGKGLLQRGAMSYNGEFANGVFDGTGTLIDANGDKYEGLWKNGAPVKDKNKLTKAQ